MSRPSPVTCSCHPLATLHLYFTPLSTPSLRENAYIHSRVTPHPRTIFRAIGTHKGIKALHRECFISKIFRLTLRMTNALQRGDLTPESCYSRQLISSTSRESQMHDNNPFKACIVWTKTVDGFTSAVSEM